MAKTNINLGYRLAKEIYAEQGINIDEAMQKANEVPISINCWQGDDVIGFDGADSLTGGIQVTGNYPGRARTADELRKDLDLAISLIPGRVKLNLHASYAEKTDSKKDRDSYTIDDFTNWTDWAVERNMGLDFNPTFFSHDMMDGDFSLSSFDETKRNFWIEHGKRCREIGLEFANRTGQVCAINYWMPDGYKDICVDTMKRRELMKDALDQIFALPIDSEKVYSSLESKLFGLGVESHTVVSHEFALGYAIVNDILYTLDAGHFHPTETISSKLTAIMPYLEKIMLHVSRPVRWDSDHIIVWDDELQNIMNEIVWNDLDKRVLIGLDFFDATLNRISAWVIGVRNARKALLQAYLTPIKEMREAEYQGDYGKRLALYETNKELPFGLVWDYYCEMQEKPKAAAWLKDVKEYENSVLSKRI